MSLRPIILISITVALAACSKPRIENLTPAVTDGSYTANDGAAIVSAIVITKDSHNDLSTYVLTTYKCKDLTTTRFSSGGVVFSSTASSVPTPSFRELNTGCDIETSAKATSSDEVRVDIKINGVAQNPSFLKKTDTPSALAKVHSSLNSSDKVEIEEESCHAAFNHSCEDLNLVSR